MYSSEKGANRRLSGGLCEASKLLLTGEKPTQREFNSFLLTQELSAQLCFVKYDGNV